MAAPRRTTDRLIDGLLSGWAEDFAEGCSAPRGRLFDEIESARRDFARCQNLVARLGTELRAARRAALSPEPRRPWRFRSRP